MKPCLIICGSPNDRIDFIKEEIDGYGFVICADSGYPKAREADVTPDLIVGDFDSYEGELPDNIEIITLRTHKDDTDSLHCLNVALERGYKEITIVGATGGRTDHALANISMLKYAAEHGARAVILSETETIFYLTDSIVIDDADGLTFSVFPYSGDSVTLTYLGEVEYPAKRLKVKKSEAVGISNIFREDCVQIIVENGDALLIIQNETI